MTAETAAPERVSCSQLARLLNVSHTAVAKAETRGRIKRCTHDLAGKPYPEGSRAWYDPAECARDWQNNTQAQMQRADGAKKGGRPRKDGTPAQPANPDAFTAAVQQMADDISGRKDGAPANSFPSVIVGLEAQPNGGALKRSKKQEETGSLDDGALVDDNGIPNLNRATATEKYYKALSAKLAYEEAAGKLVSIDAVAKIVEQEYSRVRARLLAIPSKLAPEVALIDDVSLCRSQIEASILDALSELSADQETEKAAA